MHVIMYKIWSVRNKIKNLQRCFVKGSKNYKMPAIKGHITWSMHDEAVMKEEERNAHESDEKLMFFLND